MAPPINPTMTITMPAIPPPDTPFLLVLAPVLLIFCRNFSSSGSMVVVRCCLVKAFSGVMVEFRVGGRVHSQYVFVW
jgi:hypothetical protein